MYLLETDPDVLSYQSQPRSIFYTLDNRKRRYNPDFLVERRSKKLLLSFGYKTFYYKFTY